MLEIIKEKELRIGDQTYSLDLIKEMISLEKAKNQYNFLPQIIREIDMELNKNEKK